MIEAATTDGVLKFDWVLDCVMITMNRTSPSTSSTVEAISQLRAVFDALAAPCTSPADHCWVTFRPYRLPIRAAGRPRIRLNSTPQTVAMIPQTL